MGSQVGYKPDEVLDMSLDVFQAVSAGYMDRIFDQQLLGVQAGYWAGYYGRAKKPSDPGSIVRGMIRKKDASDRRHSGNVPDVDVEGFLAMEQRFQERMNTQ